MNAIQGKGEMAQSPCRVTPTALWPRGEEGGQVPLGFLSFMGVDLMLQQLRFLGFVWLVFSLVGV